MIAKGRDYRGEILRGEQIGTSKLTRAEVLEVHRLSAEGLSQRAVAGLLEISQSHVQRILSGEAWTHVSSDAGKTLFLGIDPGLDGFCALVAPDGLPVEERKVPLLAEDEYDLPGMCELARGWSKVVSLAVLEHQQAFPGSGPPCPACKRPTGTQGVTSTFSTGRGFGLWEMALVAAGVRYELARPQKWKGAMGVLPPKGLKISRNDRTKLAKKLAIEKTQALFPGYDLRENERCRVPHAGKCEAMLMAEFARRTDGGRR
jgi:transcriptional regulator with XRE-family HTH domain